MSERTSQPARSDDDSDPTLPNAAHQSETLRIDPSASSLPSDESGYEPEAAVPPAAEPAVAPGVAPVTGQPGGRRGVRVRTVVFGVVMLVISVVTLITLTTGVRVDGTAIGLTLLLGAGAILVAGGAASAVREARGGPGAGR